MKKEDSKSMFMGKLLEDCTKEELLLCVKEMESRGLSTFGYMRYSDKADIERLKTENDKLWKALRSR
jgi:hypothetical protein